MTDNKQVEQIVRAAQPLFDWIKQYYPKIDISDDKQLSLYTSYYNLSQVLDKLKEDQNVQECDASKAEQSGEAGSQIPDELPEDYDELYALCEKYRNSSKMWCSKVMEGAQHRQDLQRELREAREEIERLKETADFFAYAANLYKRKEQLKTLQPQARQAIFRLKQIALADDFMVAHENAAVTYREIVREVVADLESESTPQPSEAQDKEL
jgi:uncharacterized phage infection (PIP) family protein YhgE